MRFSKYLITASLLVLSVAAAAQEQQLRDLTVEQATTAQLSAPHAGSLKATIAPDRADATYAIGESVRLTLTVNENAYVTVLDIGPSGLVTQLFPTKYQIDNHVLANRPVEIAGGATGARIAVAGPTGTELIKVIASNKPITVVPESQLQGNGPFRSVDGGAKALTRDLQVVADAPAPADTKISFTNLALYTISSRAPAAPQAIVIIPDQPAPAPDAAPTAAPPVAPSALRVTIPADQPFPLLLAADKASYKIGEKATIAVTSLQACNLTVLELTTAGQARTLYPNAAAPNGAVSALQTVFVAGGPSANALQLAGPAGSEQILAICATNEGASLPAQKADASADAAAVSRDLAVVAAHAGTAIASITIAIQP